MDPDHGHKALRRGRISERGRVYHVTFTTAHRTPWFRDHRLTAAACRTFAPSAAASGAELLCWVLMPDHFHGLLRLLDSPNLSRCVQQLKGRATAACHEASGNRTAMWARGFHDHAMRRDATRMYWQLRDTSSPTRGAPGPYPIACSTRTGMRNGHGSVAATAAPASEIHRA
jgi:REP element-mobilizing transposase RayT